MFSSRNLCVSAMLLAVANGMLDVTESYNHSAVLMPGNITLYWKFDDSHITFEVHGQTTGWIGIGFSPNGAMTGSDIFVGWVKNSEVNVTDRHGVGNVFPPLDPEQDIDVIEGAERDGWTMFKFTRQLAACETEYDKEITQSTQRLIWAWGNNDPTGDDITVYDYHGEKKGVRSMYFLESSPSQQQLPDGPTYHTFDVVMDNFEIPSEETYYNCRLFEVPRVTKKHHIVKVEPIITEGNERNVHHIIIHRCADILADPSELLQNARCFTRTVQHFSTCISVIAGWAVGGGAVFYPEDVGLSIGESDDPKYIQIEMHYDNPGGQSGIIDSSGLRFTYTDTVRQYDLGTIQVGLRVDGTSHIIPPHAQDFLTVGHCSSTCIENAMTGAAVEEINVIGVLLHSHLAGEKLRLKHVRGDVELEPLAKDESYDFNYQEIRYLVPPKIIKSTDRLQMECMYNTENRGNITQGGLSTQDEMCLAFMSYYPEIDLSICISEVPKEVVWPFFGIDASTVTPVGPWNRLESWQLPNSELTVSKNMYDHINEWDWTPETIKIFEASYNAAPYIAAICVALRTRDFDVFQLNITEISTPYEVTTQTCENPASSLSQSTIAAESPRETNTPQTTDSLPQDPTSRTSESPTESLSQNTTSGTSVLHFPISTTAMLLPISVFLSR